MSYNSKKSTRQAKTLPTVSEFFFALIVRVSSESVLMWFKVFFVKNVSNLYPNLNMQLAAANLFSHKLSIQEHHPKQDTYKPENLFLFFFPSQVATPVPRKFYFFILWFALYSFAKKKRKLFCPGLAKWGVKYVAGSRCHTTTNAKYISKFAHFYVLYKSKNKQ